MQTWIVCQTIIDMRKLNASVVSSVSANRTRLRPASPKRSRPTLSRMVSSRISGTIIDWRREFAEMMTDFRVLPAAALRRVQLSRAMSSSGALGSATLTHSNERAARPLKSRRPLRAGAAGASLSTSMVPSAISRMSSS